MKFTPKIIPLIILDKKKLMKCYEYFHHVDIINTPGLSMYTEVSFSICIVRQSKLILRVIHNYQCFLL